MNNKIQHKNHTSKYILYIKNSLSISLTIKTNKLNTSILQYYPLVILPIINYLNFLHKYSHIPIT